MPAACWMKFRRVGPWSVDEWSATWSSPELLVLRHAHGHLQHKLAVRSLQAEAGGANCLEHVQEQVDLGSCLCARVPLLQQGPRDQRLLVVPQDGGKLLHVEPQRREVRRQFGYAGLLE